MESSSVTEDAAAATEALNDAFIIQVPMVKDTMSFDSRQTARLRDIERRAQAEMKRKKRNWERQVEKMRDEFLRLYPSDVEWGSDEMLTDPLVARRCGSTDVLDENKMKTLYLEYPDAGRRYKIRFDVAGFDAGSIRVMTDGNRIVVQAARSDERGRQYCRKIQKPRGVDHTKFKSYLTADSILIIEAPAPSRSHSQKIRKAMTSSVHSSGSASPSSSPATDTPTKEKVGVPIFRDENGQRRLHLLIDIGTMFQPHDITVQVIKENKIQVHAKREEKTIERLSKSKFNKEYELSEKIDTYSLTGGLTAEGRLVIAADVKSQPATTACSKTTSADDSTTNHSLTVALDRDKSSYGAEQSQLEPTDDEC